MVDDIRNNTVKLRQTFNLKAKGVFVEKAENCQSPVRIRKLLNVKSAEKYQQAVGQIYFKKVANSEQKVTIRRIEKGQKIIKQKEILMQHLHKEQLYFNPAYDKI